jgi:tetratricopeptide (TPR) repeat protein
METIVRRYPFFLPKAALLLLALSFLTGGCTARDQLMGNYFLNMNEYDRGVDEFSRRLAEEPDSPLVNFYLGRLHLARNEPPKALPHLRRAVELKPSSADHHFWLGVAYWSLKQSAKERQSYHRALELNPRHVPAHVYLGHNLLDNREYAPALVHYDKALAREPLHPDALYNRALVLRKLGQRSEEIAAWKQYLKEYPDGRFAGAAAVSLNEHGDFAYRLVTLGSKSIVLGSVRFHPDSAVLHARGEQELQRLSPVLGENPGQPLLIEAYVQGNGALARQRAEVVRDFLLRRVSTLSPDKVNIRSFDRAERIRTGSAMYSLNRSVVIKTAKQ